MTFRTFAATLIMAASVAGAGSAFAQQPLGGPMKEDYPFGEIMSMKMIDKNKDGMVSKKEFMDMMTMAWEMKAKKMGVKGDMMTADQFKEILMYLKAGG